MHHINYCYHLPWKSSLKVPICLVNMFCQSHSPLKTKEQSFQVNGGLQGLLHICNGLLNLFSRLFLKISFSVTFALKMELLGLFKIFIRLYYSINIFIICYCLKASNVTMTKIPRSHNEELAKMSDILKKF